MDYAPLPQSPRALAVDYRTYRRPLDEDGSAFEDRASALHRATYAHHERLWEQAGGSPDRGELAELNDLADAGLSLVAGRTLWLGGTEYAFSRACCNFNCSYLDVRTVYDVVDAAWLLLNGCGVGFRPKAGTLHGYVRPVPRVEVVQSGRGKGEKGPEHNGEVLPGPDNGYAWTIRVGDSARAWATAVGKLLQPPRGRVDRLVIDGSNVRGAGGRLKGYGWICNGFEPLGKAMAAVHGVMNRAAGQLLDEIQILDVVNWLGTILSSRRAAEIALLEGHHPRADEFALAKKDYWKTGNGHRRQSNNTLVYWSKPTRSHLEERLRQADECGGDPGICNGEAALRKAPWMEGVNPSLRAGTRVLTDGGVVPIESLDGKWFRTPNLDGHWSRAYCRLSGRDKPLYRVRLAGGHDYYATAEHTWPVLLNGRYVKVPTTGLRPGDLLPLTRHERLTEGGEGTYDDGFFVGWVLGDGWVTVRKDTGARQVGLIVADSEPEVRERLLNYLRSRGCNATFRPSSSGASQELNTVNAALTDVLDRFGYSGKDALPAAAWSGSEDFRRGLVDALFSSDGSLDASGRNARLTFVTSRGGLARDVSDLLGCYGVRTALAKRHVSGASFPNGKDYGKSYVCHSVRASDRTSLAHFASVFRLSAASKQAKLDASPKAKVRGHLGDGHVAVLAVEETGLREDVWDVGVDDETHCFRLPHCVTGNCFEILLASKGFCVSGDTLLITEDGCLPIREAAGRRVRVWNGQRWSEVTPQITGTGQPLVRVRLSDGSHLDCTPDHRFSVRRPHQKSWQEVRAGELTAGRGKWLTESFRIEHAGGTPRRDAYTLGVLVGDGGVDARQVRLTLYGQKCSLPVAGRKSEPYRPDGYGVDAVDVYELAAVTTAEELAGLKADPAALLPLFSWDRESVLQFVAGWMDADGSNTGTGGVRLYVSGRERAARVQLLLRKCGVRSSLNPMSPAGARTNYGVRKQDIWYLQVTACRDIPCRRLDTSRGHEPAGKGKHQAVRSVEPLPGTHTVYCFNEPLRHKAVFANVLTYQCNLVTNCLPRFRRDFGKLERAVQLVARANYRQTCVDLRDGVLQPAWHQTNEALRLCGVSLTGVAQSGWLTDYQIRRLRNAAVVGAYSMADELGTPRPKAVTTIKPEGTASKVLGSVDLGEVAEGVHRPPGRYIFNWINFSVHDPLVGMLESAGYKTLPNPSDPANVLVCFPVTYHDVPFTRVDGKDVNLEPVESQFARYLRWNNLWADHHVSCTISYSPEEIPTLAGLMDRHWDEGFIACSFLRRNDPTKTAADLGHPYLPQEVVTEAAYLEYSSRLREVDWSRVSGWYEIDDAACAGGACPVR